jgi:hypothetical protein
MSLLIPVREVIYLGMGHCGFTKVWYFPSTSFPLCKMIAISVMYPEAA